MGIKRGYRVGFDIHCRAGNPVTTRDDKIAIVMGEFKRGTLKSSSGKKVTNRKQALAIANSEGNRVMRKKGKTTKKPTKGKGKFGSRLKMSLGERHRGTKGNLAARAKESKGEEKALGRRAYAAVKTMDKGKKKKAKKRKA